MRTTTTKQNPAILSGVLWEKSLEGWGSYVPEGLGVVVGCLLQNAGFNSESNASSSYAGVI
jgi:hypothetical protein